MKRLLIPLAAVALAACDCSGGGPPAGVCNGTWAGRTFSDAGIDPGSRVVIEKTQVCGLQDIKRYELAWEQSKLALNFSFRTGGPTSLSPVEYVLPPDAGVTPFETYSLVPEVPGYTGKVRLTIVGLRGRRGTTLDLSAGSEQLSCTFDVPYVTEGRSVCPSGGGGGDGD